MRHGKCTTHKAGLSPTGRVLADPPLQNIPVRTEEGRKIRRMFGSYGCGRNCPCKACAKARTSADEKVAS